MLTYSDLLAKVYEDGNIEKILESLGCENIHIEQCGKLIVAQRPNGRNKRAVQVKNIESLRSSIRSKGVHGNLYDIVMYINSNSSLKDAYQYIIDICGYSKNTVYIESPLAWLNKVKRQRSYYHMKYEQCKVLDECILNEYIYQPIQQYIDDGVSYDTQKVFKVGYDVITQRITTPIYDSKGELIGVKGRATNKEDAEDFKFYFLYPADQSTTLFNFHRAKEYCQIYGEVNVFEAEKSPMQAYEFDLMNAVGVGSSGISLEQLNLLLSLQCDINICYDKGVDWELICQTYIDFFKDKRDVYALIDEEGILPDKASPTDGGVDIWEKVYNNRIKIC